MTTPDDDRAHPTDPAEGDREQGEEAEKRVAEEQESRDREA